MLLHPLPDIPFTVVPPKISDACCCLTLSVQPEFDSLACVQQEAVAIFHCKLCLHLLSMELL